MTTGRVLLVVWLAACLTFAILPGIDLAVARFFFVEGEGFALGGNRGLQLVREGIWNLSHLVALLVLVFGAHALVSRRELRVPGRFWGYAVALILVAPILIVNVILKEYWGRARPTDVTEFGGALAFTPPWEIAGQCAGNCSFTSGEAASAATLAVLFGLAAWHSVRGQGRPYLVAGLVAFSLVAAVLRMAVGRHFLSDVLWSNIIVVTVAYALARLFRLSEFHEKVTLSAIAADTKTAGQGLAALVRRLARRGRAAPAGGPHPGPDDPKTKDTDASVPKV